MPTKSRVQRLIKSRQPARLVLLYILFGAIWVSLNNLFPHAHNEALAAHTLIDLAFIAISGLLLYLLLKNRETPIAPPEQDLQLPKFKSKTPYLVASFICLLLIVPLINLTVNYVYAPKLESSTAKNLRLIARIKVVQYERWRESRIGDAQVVAADQNFARLVERFRSGADKASASIIRERFDAMIRAYDFEGISLYSADGTELLRRGDAVISEAVQQDLMQQSLASGQVHHSDLYLAGHGRIQQDIIAPLALHEGQRRIIGFAIIHTGLDRFILPRVLSWPSASSSAEVLIINNARGQQHIIHTVKNKREAAITTQRLSANTPYSNSLNMQQGLGYHGNRVYTVQEPLSSSSWKIITQIDREEVLAPLQTLLLWVSGIALAAVGLVALVLMLLWRQQRRSYQLELLNESNERDRLLKRFYDLPFLGMAITHPGSMRWLRVNDKLCNIMGYKREELLRMDWASMTHPDDVEADLHNLERCMRGEIQSYSLEKRFLHKNGSIINTHIEVNCIRQVTGEVEVFLAAIEDITERKQAENALRLQEEFNRVLLENLADGVIACDSELNLVLFNQTARDWQGLDAVHVPREQWSHYFGLYDAEGMHELAFEEIPLVRAFNGETMHHAAMSIKASGQPTRFIACSAACFYDGSGKKLGAVAIMRDITVSLRHTQALRESEALYRRMFGANPHPMWVYDMETFAFLSVNDATINRYGWSREEFMAMTIFDIRPVSERTRLCQHLPPIASNDAMQSGEWKHLKKDGTLIDVEITSHPFNYAGREARLVTAYDITARKRDELEIRTLNRLLLMLSNISQAIVRRLDPMHMFQEACTIAVRDGEFRMAWIGLVEKDGRRVKPVASMGETGNYLENINIDLGKPELRGPTIRAIREGRYAVSHDVTEDIDSLPWRENAIKAGFRGIVALPLKVHGKVVGNFSLYSSEAGVFNEREMNLLDELAGDISFALEIAEAEQLRLQTQKALQESEALFQTLASSSPVGILRTNLDGHTLYVNESGRKMAGLQPNQHKSSDWTRATHPEDRKRVQAEWRNAGREQRGFSLEYRFRHRDGSITWVKGQAEPEKDNQGNFLGFVGTITDITALKASEESLRMSAAVFENTREGVMVTDADTRMIMVNRAFTDITQFGELDVLGKTPKVLASGRHDRGFYRQLWNSLNEIGYWQGEIWNRRKNGDVHPVLMSISAIKNKNGQVGNYVGVFADISNLKASEAQLEFLAHHDPLTRLPNRLMLISRVDHAIEVVRRENKSLALLMLDLDRFKNVNDSFGHLSGDELLQQVAQRLTERLRNVDTVTRLGGDEFTVLLEGLNSREDAVKVAQDIIKTLEAPWKLSNNIEVRISASVGISLFPDHANNSHELLQHADAALYQAKSAGRGCARFFSESLTQAARDRFNIEARLREAIPGNELRVYYQPKLDMISGKILGAEALVRWQHPQEGLISPSRFIGIAEDTGLIIAMGEWMMMETCRQGKAWLDAGLPPLSLAINLSAHQLHHSDIVKTLTEVLEQTGFPAELVELELTESILMQREADVIETLNILRNKGIRLAIDDFGTGYSSLSYLKSFPLDILKIDKSFVHDIETDPDDRAITATIIGIAHTLDMQVVAEGVETVEQLEFLREHKCDLYQGYLVSEPVPAEQFLEFIKAHNAGK